MHATLALPPTDPSPDRLLPGLRGWERSDLPPLRIMAGRRRVVLHPIARRDGRIALLHRSRAGRALPDHSERCAVLRRVEHRVGAAVVVFCDALGGVEWWQWTHVVPGGITLLHGRLLLPGDPRAPLAERLAVADAPAPRPCPTPAPEDLRALLRGVLRRAGETPPPAPTLRGVIARIETCGTPALIRRWWRALDGLAVLDPRCGSGERLLAAAGVLAPLVEVCLERMAASVDELRLLRGGHRPERLGDFRRLLARADDPRRFRDRGAFALWRVLRGNLHGADPDGDELARAGERLLAAARGEAAQAASPAPHLALFHGDVGAGFGTAAEVQAAGGGGALEAAAVARLAECAETVAAARRMLRRMEEQGDGDRDTVDHGAVEERLATLRRELDGWGERRGRRPVHLWAEAWDVMRRGGFDVVLGPPAPDPGGRQLLRETRAKLIIPPGALRQPQPGHPRAETLTLPPDGDPLRLRERLGAEAPDTLFLRGDPALLQRPLLAFFSSAAAPADAILRTLDAARAIRDAGVATIGGFHSPLERELLRFLLRGDQPVVVVAARRIEPLRLPREWAEAVSAGRMLLLSRFDARWRRGTARTAEVRNRLAAALAERALIGHAGPGSRTERLARRLVEWGAPVCTWDGPASADLARLGVRPIRVAEECLL